MPAAGGGCPPDAVVAGAMGEGEAEAGAVVVSQREGVVSQREGVALGQGRYHSNWRKSLSLSLSLS